MEGDEEGMWISTLTRIGTSVGDDERDGSFTTEV